MNRQKKGKMSQLSYYLLLLIGLDDQSVGVDQYVV
jgi:hypothetical protein